MKIQSFMKKDVLTFLEIEKFENNYGVSGNNNNNGGGDVKR